MNRFPLLDRKVLLFLLIASFGILLINIIVPFFSKVFYDVIVGLLIFSWADWFFALLAIVIVVYALLVIVKKLTLIHLNTKLSVEFSSKYLWHILRLPITFFQQRFGGEVAHRLFSNEMIIDEITGRLGEVILNLLFIIFYAIVLLWYNIPIALVGIAAVIINLTLLFYTQGVHREEALYLEQSNGKFLGFLMEGLNQIETIQSTHTENTFFTRLSAYFGEVINTEQSLGKKYTWINTLPNLLSSLTSTVLIAVGGYQVIFDNFTLGLFMASQALLINLMAPAASLVDLSKVSQSVLTNLTRVNAVLSNPIDPLFTEQDVTGSEHQIHEGHLELRNVTFGYSPGDPSLIEEFNLTVMPGQRVALVGRSGSGKTTLAHLINGILHPWSGEILIDGKPRSTLTREEITENLTSIDQDIFLFSGTIKDNLTLFDPSVSDEEIMHAAKDALIHDEVVEKPLGYHYPLIEEGMNLSGGQRQRLEIARGFLLNPKILILDEATSALDAHSEDQIMHNVKKRGYTTIVVTHRLNTIRTCDEIIVLDRGKVVQRGTHDSLQKQAGIYRDVLLRDIDV